MRSYCDSRFRAVRRHTREVKVGSVGIGGNNPIRVQSMTTSLTQDVEATLRQCIRLAEAGCEVIRITAPNKAAAEALKAIRTRFSEAGFRDTPLVADIHFLPSAAMVAVEHVEKIRVNPGNYADKKKFAVKEYSDSEYDNELQRLHEAFSPLVKRAKTLGRALRIGTNHGSLSDRIMNRYGDSPLGMVESALEFIRIAEDHDFHDIILSMKASNTKVMVAAYRLVVARMIEENMHYPLHLGVTEAGDGEDARIKSAIGIGALLYDGLGDTIRVSLTEDPWFEVPVAQDLARRAEAHWARSESLPVLSSEPQEHLSPYDYRRREIVELALGPQAPLGPMEPPRVVTRLIASLPGDAPKVIETARAANRKLKDARLEGLLLTITTPEALDALPTLLQGLTGEAQALFLDLPPAIKPSDLDAKLCTPEADAPRLVLCPREGTTDIPAWGRLARKHQALLALDLCAADIATHADTLRTLSQGTNPSSSLDADAIIAIDPRDIRANFIQRKYETAQTELPERLSRAIHQTPGGAALAEALTICGGSLRRVRQTGEEGEALRKAVHLDEAHSLEAWAKANGHFIPEDAFNTPWEKGGKRGESEHHVYFDAGTQSWWKRNLLNFHHGSISSYLERIAAQAFLFPTVAPRFEGFTTFEGQLLPVISQAHALGDEPGEAEITHSLRQLGFVEAYETGHGMNKAHQLARDAGLNPPPLSAPSRAGFYHPELALWLEDVHEENASAVEGLLEVFDPVVYLINPLPHSQTSVAPENSTLIVTCTRDTTGGQPGDTHPSGAFRALAAALHHHRIHAPLWLRVTEDFAIQPVEGFGRALLEASIFTGNLFIDGLGDILSVETVEDPIQATNLAYNILQGARMRTVKTEYVACPSCGRTLFDLQEVTTRIKARTGHLKGVTIAVMGCIVNGPGEMADADFGYVGGAPGKINLYVGKECVQYNIAEEDALDNLVALIQSHGKWVEPAPEPVLV